MGGDRWHVDPSTPGSRAVGELIAVRVKYAVLDPMSASSTLDVHKMDVSRTNALNVSESDRNVRKSCSVCGVSCSVTLYCVLSDCGTVRRGQGPRGIT